MLQKDGGVFVVEEAADGIGNSRSEFVHSVGNGCHVGPAAVVAVVENCWGPWRMGGGPGTAELRSPSLRRCGIALGFVVDFVVVELDINSTLRRRWHVPSFASLPPPPSTILAMSSPQAATDSALNVIGTDTLVMFLKAAFAYRGIRSTLAFIWRYWTTAGIISSKLEWLAGLPRILANVRHFRKDQFLSEATLERMKGFDIAYLR